jgi:amino acid adenylation domain-containing protein
MVPQHFVELESIPLTPNGKVDRKALPKPELGLVLEKTFVAPRSETEQRVAAIWQEVLKLEKVGVYDNFFELGGHSLLVTRIISRIHESMDTDLPLRSLFENPMVVDLATYIDLKKGKTNVLRLPQVVPISRDKSLPLSFSQERLWFLQQLEPESTAYSMPTSIHMRGRLDHRAMDNAFKELVRRHESFRTTFRSVDGKPEQFVSSVPIFTMLTEDLRKFPISNRMSEAERLIEERSRVPFDLSSGPLFRIALYRLGDEDHVLHINMHHTIFDYWSYGIMTRELEKLYNAFIHSEAPQLTDLTVQYADFAHCQREWLQGDVLATYLGYWKNKLGGELATLNLPTDRPRPAVQTHRSAIESLILPQNLVQKLKDLSRREGLTLFMTLLTAFKALLFRITGQEDIILGTPISGRNRSELEGLIGFFMNTIVMRTDLSGHPTFKELLGRVRETALGAYAHQEMPFEKLVEVLEPKRDLSRTPLFQVFFNHIRADENEIELKGLEVEVAGGIEREAMFDMTLYVWEKNDGIRLTALYNVDLFDDKRIAIMLEQYQSLLNQAVENPEDRITNFSLLTPRQEILLPNMTATFLPQWAGSVHKRFSEQARRIPEHTAIVDKFGSWNYGELEQYSNKIAGYLRSQGIRAGDVIAIYGHRSAGLVLGLLGILKAGAAFLVLDSRYPTERLIKMLEESSPRGWLQMEAAGPVAEELNTYVDSLNVVCRFTIPRLKKEIETVLQNQAMEALQIEVFPDDRAYITFTSGTTGQPKGIIGTHRPLSHFLEWHCREFNLKESDRFSMLSGLSHDPLLRDIFTPLWLGAMLCIPDPDELLIPEKIRNWMGTQQITVAHITPAVGQLLIEAENGGDSNKKRFLSLRYVFFGGDILTYGLVKKTCGMAPKVTCVNFYGATETPQAMGYHVVNVQKEENRLWERIPLGKGIEGVQLLVLNYACKLAGVGELGEICVRTPYLTKGYLNDEILTGEKFIYNPFTNGGEDRVYRTGDLGHYLPGGSVMFYGRADRQVSIRGFRVELGEIESQLRELDIINNVVVELREDHPDDKRLVAYYVAKSGCDISISNLRKYLHSKLPDYMVPQHFVRLESIPISPNGKVNRNALPKPDFEKITGNQYEAPQTEMERKIAAIWQEVLKYKNVGIHDDFFELGGHSLLATQVMSRIKQLLNIEIPLRSLFETRTVSSLANLIDISIWANSQSVRNLPRENQEIIEI